MKAVREERGTRFPPEIATRRAFQKNKSHIVDSDKAGSAKEKAKYVNVHIQLILTLHRQQNGILPMEKSTLSNEGAEGYTKTISKWGVDFHSIRFNTVGGFRFLGQGTSYETCGNKRKGEQKYNGCLDKSHPKTAVVKFIKNNCGRAECPICSDTWINETTQKIAHRLKEGAKRLKKNGFRHTKPIHVSISPPIIIHKYFNEQKYVKHARRECYRLAKEAGISGGSVIYHPYRERCGDCGGKIAFGSKRCSNCGAYNIVWYFSPHFHLFCYGWVTNTEKIEKITGWVIKNHGVRKSVEGTIHYQLSHCGVAPNWKTVTYFGSFAYNKLKGVPKLILHSDKCPICHKKLVPIIYHLGKPPPLNPEEINYTNPEGWTYLNYITAHKRKPYKEVTTTE